MKFKDLFRRITLTLFLAIAANVMIAQNKSNVHNIVNPEYIIGDWFAQIDMPQGEITCLMEMNMLDGENCVIWIKFSGSVPSEEESGKAKYKLEGNKLVIKFLNEEEVIKLENIFDLENVYDINLTKDRLVILNNEQFRNIDVNFGRGYENRGFAEIIFPEDD